MPWGDRLTRGTLERRGVQGVGRDERAHTWLLPTRATGLPTKRALDLQFTV